MVLVDYIGIYFTCGNTFGHILITMFGRLYVRVGILLTCAKHLHNRIVSLMLRSHVHLMRIKFASNVNRIR